MNLFSVPYPKANFARYLIVVALISLSVIFILTVLQPFGTASFDHEYKYSLLSGYGAAIFVVSMLYYVISDRLLSTKVKDKWSVVHEVVFLFLNVILCLVGCYFYWGFAFGANMNTFQFFHFILSAFSVAIFPVAAYLLFIFMKYREVKMVGNEIEKTNEENITLKGTSNIKS